MAGADGGRDDRRAIRRRVLIVGGGTAGHTNPGIAIAEALVEAGIDRSDIGFVGSRRGNEATLVPAAGFDLDVLPGRGVPRRVGLAAVKSVIELAGGMGAAIPLLRRRNPEVVVCLGGFAAFAPAVGARLLGVPVVVTEQNSRASAVNRFVARFAADRALPFPSTDLPRGGVLTGNPIRRVVAEGLTDRSGTQRRRARAELGVRDGQLLVAVWAGSLGADRINRAVRELARLWIDREDLVLHHVVGRRNAAALAPLDVDGSLVYRTVPYEDDMLTLLLAADLAVTRGGASTVAELSVAGLPAIIVPLPGAPRDHQRTNAEELVAQGLAVVMDDASLSGAALATTVESLLDPGTRARMRSAVPAVDHAAAAGKVAQMVLRHLQHS